MAGVDVFFLLGLNTFVCFVEVPLPQQTCKWPQRVPRPFGLKTWSQLPLCGFMIVNRSRLPDSKDMSLPFPDAPEAKPSSFSSTHAYLSNAQVVATRLLFRSGAQLAQLSLWVCLSVLPCAPYFAKSQRGCELLPACLMD